MERWSGILKVPLYPNCKSFYRVGASLCLSSSSSSSSSKTLSVPSANAIFFHGDRVAGTGNPVIEKLSDLQKVAEILVSKSGASVNAWVIEASIFNGPFAVYKDFITSMTSTGEPKSYCPVGFPASTATVSLLSNSLQEAKNIISTALGDSCSANTCESYFYDHQPRTLILGFSKGGVVLNQLVSELAFLEEKSTASEATIQEEIQIVPTTKDSLLNSITEIHYVDVGLNSAGAYISDPNVIERISKRLMEGSRGLRFALHGTPRQWCDGRRAWICDEKDKLVHILQQECQKNGGILQVCERFYFADRPPDMQMHFEIIESLNVN